MTNETKYLIPVDPLGFADVYANDDQPRQVVAMITEAVKPLQTDDVSTAAARKRIASAAAKVASTKVALDQIRTAKVGVIKAELKKYDQRGKWLRDSLDQLKAETRAPLDRWEQQQARAQKEIARYEGVPGELHDGLTSQRLTARLAHLRGQEPTESDYGEWHADVRRAWEYATLKIREAVQAAKIREQAEAEAEREREREREQAEKVRKENEELRRKLAEAEARAAQVAEATRPPEPEPEKPAPVAGEIREDIERVLRECPLEDYSGVPALSQALASAIMRGKIRHVRVEEF